MTWNINVKVALNMIHLVGVFFGGLYKILNKVSLTVLNTIFTERNFTFLQLLLKSCLDLKLKFIFIYI